MTRRKNLMIPFAEVSKFPSSVDLVVKTNFQNKAGMLLYVEKYTLKFSTYNS